MHNEKSHTMKIIKTYFIGNVMLAIDYTYLLRILQRTFRRKNNYKKQKIEIRKNPRELYYRQKYGKWSKRASF